MSLINKLSCEIAYGKGMNISNDGVYACAEGLKTIGISIFITIFLLIIFIEVFHSFHKKRNRN